MIIYFIGPPGSDAPGVYIGSDGKIHRVPGWNPESTSELSHALGILREASQLKTPGLAEAAINSVLGFAQKELGAHAKDGGAIVVMG